MTPKARPAPLPGGQTAPQGRRPRWLLLVHQLPSHPSNLRVRTWRRLQQLGAMPIKQAVYVLPDSPGGREDFEWLSAEIKGAGGEASVFAAELVDRLVRRCAGGGVQAFAAGVVCRIGPRCRTGARPARTNRRRRGARAPSTQRLLGRFRQRLAAIEAVDFFGSAGRDRVAVLLEAARGSGGRPSGWRAPPASRSAGTRAQPYRGRLWVTRPRPGVDRMASAWLIRALHRSAGAVRLRGSAKRLADGARALRHVRCRLQPSGRRLHVRDALRDLRHPGGRPCRARRGDRARPRPQGRTVRCARGADCRRRDRGPPTRACRRPGAAGAGHDALRRLVPVVRSVHEGEGRPRPVARPSRKKARKRR